MSKIGKSLLQGAEEALAYVKGTKVQGIKKHSVKIPKDIDVKAIRQKLKMDRTTFAEHFGFSICTLEKWEQSVRQPESPTRAYLKVIEFNPQMVEQALRV